MHTDSYCPKCLMDKGLNKTKHKIVDKVTLKCTICGHEKLWPGRDLKPWKPDPKTWKALGYDRIYEERKREGLRRTLVWGK